MTDPYLALLRTELDEAHVRICELEVTHVKLIRARDLSAIASATMRDESVAKSQRIAELEAENKRLREQLATELVYGPDRTMATPETACDSGPRICDVCRHEAKFHAEEGCEKGGCACKDFTMNRQTETFAVKPAWDCACNELDCPYCANRLALTSTANRETNG